MRKRRTLRKLPPRYLEAEARIRVRFQEVDMLRVVWHGHYLSYFEEGRLAFGKKYGFDYQDVLEAGYVVPLVHVELDYYSPARYGDELLVDTRLYPEEAARVTFTYTIRNATDNSKLASGLTVQAFTDKQGNLILTRPPYYLDFLARWDPQMLEE